MASKEQNLTHEEIWDDSALVDSWNDALLEYKKYHSIHSKGGNVDDVLNPSRNNESSDAKPGELPAASSAKEEELEVEKDGVEQDQAAQGQHSLPPAVGSAFIPAPLLGSVRNESLQKLLMSWYYAGYYTGLYEGQQAQQQ